MFCRGVCAFPTISREPRIVFKHRRKFRKREEIVHKKFILNSETYEFGPLLCGKTREKYKEGKYPENMETMTISNTSPLPAEVSFCFQHDNNGTTFLLDPPSMSLKCGESDVSLSVCLPACVFVCLFIGLFVCLYVCLLVCLLVCLSPVHLKKYCTNLHEIIAGRGKQHLTVLYFALHLDI